MRVLSIEHSVTARATMIVDVDDNGIIVRCDSMLSLVGRPAGEALLVLTQPVVTVVVNAPGAAIRTEEGAARVE